MELSQFMSSAEELAKIIWPIKNNIKLVDLVLRGSVARKVQNPVDLDMIIIHSNQCLDEFQDLLREKKFTTPQEAFYYLVQITKEGIDLSRLFAGSSIEKLISKNLFHTSYMNTKYFTDLEYKKKWDSKNKPEFLKSIFSEGILWNPATKKYDIQISRKYSITKQP
ncbi:MAG: hypothetical protein ABH804_02020 [archaeon]